MRKALPAVAALFVCSLGACRQVAEVFLDLPQPTGGQAGVAATGADGRPLSTDQLLALLDSSRNDMAPPPIETLAEPSEILKALPADSAGGIDWVAAMASGVIRPRPSVPGQGASSPRASTFGYDLFLRDGSTDPEAFFPHTTHQAWLSCASCHPAVYPRGAESVDPDSVHGATSCGKCHDQVAFPISSCERCHAGAAGLPTGRQRKRPDRGFKLIRHESERVQEEGEAVQALMRSYPPAHFSHFNHRLRYQCRACHEDLFSMTRGERRLPEDVAHGSRGCGACHDGRAAFDLGASDCARCHR